MSCDPCCCCVVDLICQIFNAVWIRKNVNCLNVSQFVAVEWFLAFGCFLFGKTNFILKKAIDLCNNFQLVLFNNKPQGQKRIEFKNLLLSIANL